MLTLLGIMLIGKVLDQRDTTNMTVQQPAKVKNSLNFSKITTFLPLTMIGMTFAASLAIGVVGYLNGQAGLQKATVTELTTLAHSKADLLTLKLDTVKNDLATMATSSATKIVMEELNKAVVNFSFDIPAVLKYFQAPEDAIERAKLNGDEDTMYSFAHKNIHKSFSTSLLASGYGDVYVLNAEGRIIYSVAKSGDFLKSVADEELAGTELNSLFNQVKDAPVGKQVSTFLKPYKFADNAPALFVAEPVWIGSIVQDPKFMGIVVIRLDVGFFNGLIAKTEGLGKTGQLYLTDNDGLLLSDMPRASKPTSLSKTVKYDLIPNAAVGQINTEGVAVTSDGIDIMLAVRPFNFLDKKWVIVAERSMDEALGAIHKMRDGMLIGGLIVLLIAAIIAIMVSKSITKPLSRLTSNMRSLSKGDMNDNMSENYWINELSIMANALVVFKKNAIARVKAEVEKAELDKEELKKAQYISGLIESFHSNSKNSIGNVNQASNKLEDVSKDLNESASEMQNQSRLVIGSVQDTSHNVTSAASATEEMVSSISEIAQQASLSTDIAEEARNKTTQTVKVINTLSSSAKHIEQVVKLIE